MSVQDNVRLRLWGIEEGLGDAADLASAREIMTTTVSAFGIGDVDTEYLGVPIAKASFSSRDGSVEDLEFF